MCENPAVSGIRLLQDGEPVQIVFQDGNTTRFRVGRKRALGVEIPYGNAPLFLIPFQALRLWEKAKTARSHGGGGKWNWQAQ